MDKNINNIMIDTETEENNEEYTTIIESYRCRSSPYNHQGRKSLNSSKTSPITPPPKLISFNKSNINSKKSIEKIKSYPILINNLNECIENLKTMLSNKKSSQNVVKDINKNFRLYDDDKDYDISDVSSLDLNEEN